MKEKNKIALSISKSISRFKLTDFGRRLTAVFLVFALLFTVTAPAAAEAFEENTSKQEVIYINLNNDGSVEKISAVNIFDLSEDGKIIDYGSYTELRNMTSDDEIVFDDEKITIDTKAGKLYYEGIMSDDSIPWHFKIRYFLNGQERTASELAGCSGDLKITVDISKNIDCNSTFFDNYALQASLTLDTELCSDITDNGATSANVGKNRQLTYTILPGQSKNIEVSAHVENFEMASISINGLPISMDFELTDEQMAEIDEQVKELQDAVAKLDDGATELNDGAAELQDGAFDLKDGVFDLKDGSDELYDGAVELKDGSVELYDGTVELGDGVTDLLDGAEELNDGAADLEDGANDLTDGIDEAVDGSLKLYNGAADLKKGAAELSVGMSGLASGLNTLSAQGQNLIDAAYMIYQQLVASAESQLNAALAGAGEEGISMGTDDYGQVISAIMDNLSGGAYTEAEAQAKENIRQQAENTAVEQVATAMREDSDIMAQIDTAVENGYGSELDQQAEAYITAAFAKEMAPDDPEGFLASEEGQAALAEYLSGEQGKDDFGNAREQIKEKYIDAALLEQARPQVEANEEIQAQIDLKVEEMLADEAVQSEIAAAVEDALSNNEGYQGIVSLKSQLDGYGAFYAALCQYVAGVDSAAASAAKLQKGAAALASGADELYDGADELYDGLQEIYDGSMELLDGTIELHDGTAELYDGVVELKDGSTELLDGVIELKDGTVELYDGTVELKDGVIELLDGAIELYDGTVELHDGTIELKDGTFEFRNETAELDTEIKDKITSAINEALGGDFDVVSFTSDKNTNVESVQFVIKTDGIQIEETEEPEPENEDDEGFLSRFTNLFK